MANLLPLADPDGASGARERFLPRSGDGGGGEERVAAAPLEGPVLGRRFLEGLHLGAPIGRGGGGVRRSEVVAVVRSPVLLKWPMPRRMDQPLVHS